MRMDAGKMTTQHNTEAEGEGVLLKLRLTDEWMLDAQDRVRSMQYLPIQPVSCSCLTFYN
jgi:hypothetical protein